MNEILPDFLLVSWLSKPIWMWLAFLLVVVLLLVLDLGVLHKEKKAIGVAESLKMSAFYITIGLLWAGVVWWMVNDMSGPIAAKKSTLEYLTGFVVEKTLAMDNIFVIAMIFGYFAVPPKYQHRVLFWGILGVILLRGIMIGLGATLVAEFGWLLYVFAVFLIITGVKMIMMADKETSIADNPLLKLLNSKLRVTKEHHGEKFFVKMPHDKSGKPVTYVTPLFLALIMIEFADVIFAVDSVPAIFSITTDPYIVYTSNIFAILGLRALYFALAAMIERFKYLKYALSVVLIFIGSKIFIADLLGLEKFPAAISLSITVGILAAGVFYSLWRTRSAAKA